MDFGGDLLKSLPVCGRGAVLGWNTLLPAWTLLRLPEPDSSPEAQTPTPKMYGLSRNSPGCSRYPQSFFSYPATLLATLRHRGPQSGLALRTKAARRCCVCRSLLGGRHAETGQHCAADAQHPHQRSSEGTQSEPAEAL